jgi:hypothetical protein
MTKPHSTTCTQFRTIPSNKSSGFASRQSDSTYYSPNASNPYSESTRFEYPQGYELTRIRILLLILHQTRQITSKETRRQPSSKFFPTRREIYKVLTEVKLRLKNVVFWDVSPCKSCVQSATTCSRWFLAQGFFYPEDGGNTFLRSVELHNIYTAPHPRRWHSS